MSESQQRLICRLAFIFACLLPTSIVIWLVFSPGRIARWESTFQDGLGLETRIESVTTPLPGITELHQVSLHDFQAGHLLDLADIKLVNTPQETRCYVSEFKIEAGQLGTLLGRINALLEKKSSQRNFRVYFDGIHVVHRNPVTDRFLSAVLEDCLLVCHKTATGKRIVFDFDLTGTSANPCLLTLSVVQAKDKYHIKWNLETKETPVPCWLISGWIQQLALLGDDCTFSGNATGSLTVGNPWAQVEGTFDNLDLCRLVQQSLPHELTGLATIDVQNCMITPQGILGAEGRVRSKQEGVIGPTLLAAARQYLWMKTLDILPTEPIPFGRIDFNFATRNQTKVKDGLETRVMEIAIHGNDTGSLIMDSYGNPLLTESELEFLPIGNLLQTLLPNGQQQALASPQCRQLLALFPSHTQFR